MKSWLQLSRIDGTTLLIVFILALCLRLVFVLQIHYEPFSDMAHYDQIARSLLEGKGFSSDGRVTAYRPPGYPIFVALVYSICGSSPAAVRIVQAVLGAFTCCLVFFLVRLFLQKSPLSERVLFGFKSSSLGALLAAFLSALFDEWIFFTGQLLTEILYTFFLTLWILAIIRWVESKTIVSMKNLFTIAGIGILSGLLTLIRPVALFSIALAFLYGCWRKRKVGTSRGPILRLSGAFAVGWLLCCLPWMVRNGVHFGPLTGLSTNTGVNFYIGHNPYFGYWSTGDKQRIRNLTDYNEAEESRMFLKIGLRYALTHPGMTIYNSFRKLDYLFLEPWQPWPTANQNLLDPWNPWSKNHQGPYKPWPWIDEGRIVHPEGPDPLALLSWDLPFILLVLAGVILAIRDRCSWGLLYWIIGGQILPYLVFFARARFRIPLGLFFSLFAAYAIIRAIQYIRDRNFQKNPG